VRAWILAIVLLAALGLAAPASAAPEDDLRRTLGRLTGRAGSQAGASVVDARGGRTIFARRAGRPRSLGSNTKLFTAAAALRKLAPLTTEALATAPLAPDGTIAGDLVIRGGGDPSLGAAAAGALADQIQAAGVRVIAGSVVGDESRFDAVRGTPATGNAFNPEIGGVLGALTYERGRAVAGGPFLSDPARAAAAAVDDALEARGIVVRGVPRQGVGPAGAPVLARVAAPIPPLVRTMLKGSDNFVAETLAKALGAGTTAAGARAVEAEARRLGAPARLADGSGLVLRNRATPRAVVALLRRMRGSATWRNSLPIGGRDGTLANRLTAPGVRGRCRAKTGSMPERRVSGLSGYCRSRRGRTLVFSLLIGGRGLARAKALEDRFASALARYRG
jgi:D-alanyl-D-alanine carboxypeptidase/D-alanyl-D-alanine-endopeptidase (penicillin-binding protein 4)